MSGRAQKRRRPLNADLDACADFSISATQAYHRPTTATSSTTFETPSADLRRVKRDTFPLPSPSPAPDTPGGSNSTPLADDTYNDHTPQEDGQEDTNRDLREGARPRAKRYLNSVSNFILLI